ncbi:hypothetical protein VOLCADRAFT_106379 [Volvox carteri f. nagariensis]|uniref:Histidine biosynthesis HisG C-terminal domain-containing protein n=1 Tax=Volvox carteri f. nagariensis TaxID=3068 RepID=D8U723_VOLCA|nr:uncharacterized protein VOLCADRAFT_106379 [Volvox carteri f. nagariensis]EFJ44610.1 hypothetical protein VOLCADRAFT_106379 [Volvox carteri f. nagariensis]|eukprot:XP_002954460.1 hypothetical protein VOLCADRAFT_106379 [Volvox carteri f. nagariensis]
MKIKSYGSPQGLVIVLFPYVPTEGGLSRANTLVLQQIALLQVSTGVTLRENNLKEIEGGNILESQGMLVGSRKSLLASPELLDVGLCVSGWGWGWGWRWRWRWVHFLCGSVRVGMGMEMGMEIVHELIERFDGHLKAEQYYSVIANMRGNSPEQGPTICNVYNRSPQAEGAKQHFYAATICVRKKQLYGAVKALQKLGGSGVLVQPMTYIFDEEPARWTKLLTTLGLDPARYNGNGNGNDNYIDVLRHGVPAFPAFFWLVSVPVCSSWPSCLNRGSRYVTSLGEKGSNATPEGMGAANLRRYCLQCRIQHAARNALGRVA